MSTGGHVENTGRPEKSDRHGYREIAGRKIVFDDEGFFWRSVDWHEEVAEALAHEEGFALTADHWKVIRFLREFYNYQGRAPLNRQLTKGTGFSMLYIENLFPGGIKNGARRIAGLPNPKAC